jgi:hypothetical protein
VKLFQVNMIVGRCESDTCYVVASSEHDAKQRVLDDEDCYVYSAHAHEVNKIDGYKVVFLKGKKIGLVKD